MPRRTRHDLPRFDTLEPRALFDAACIQPGIAAHNPNLSAAEIEAFMSGSDGGEDMATSTATSDADMYAPLTKPQGTTPLRGVIGAADKAPSLDDPAWGDRRAADAPAIAARPESDDQTPVIVSAAHGDAKAVAIMLSWSEQSGNDDSTITSSTGKPAQGTVGIQSSFLGDFVKAARKR